MKNWLRKSEYSHCGVISLTIPPRNASQCDYVTVLFSHSINGLSSHSDSLYKRTPFTACPPIDYLLSALSSPCIPSSHNSMSRIITYYEITHYCYLFILHVWASVSCSPFCPSPFPSPHPPNSFPPPSSPCHLPSALSPHFPFVKRGACPFVPYT